MLAERHGYTHEEIAEAVGKSRTVVTESLSLLQMPPRVRDTVQALGLTPSRCCWRSSRPATRRR